MSALRTIVAGIEHPSADDPVLAAAAALARWSGAELHLVHSYELPPIHSIPLHDAFTRHDEEVRRALSAAAATVPGAEGAVCHAMRGSATHALLQGADQLAAQLLVIGAGGGHTLLGGSARRVLRGASVPVLVIRRPVRRPLGRLLTATDLSERSAAAHERGLELAADLFGGASAVRAALVVGSGALPAPLPDAALARTARAELRLFLRAHTPRSLRVEPVVRAGRPADEIVAEAEEWGADLLVVGTHGRVLLGSVAETVLRDAPCNVLAVPPGGEGADAGEAREHGAAAPKPADAALAGV